MDEQNKRETVEKIINTIEHPDSREHKSAITSRERRERRQEQADHIFRLIFNLALLALLAILFVSAWPQSISSIGKWGSLISGSVLGILICIVAERSKKGIQRSLSPQATFIFAILIIATGLFVSWFKGFVDPLSMPAIKLAGGSFLLIVWGYATFVSWKKVKE
jgi:hypothetical protein